MTVRWASLLVGVALGFLLSQLGGRASSSTVFTVCGDPILVSIVSGDEVLEFDPERMTPDLALRIQALVQRTKHSGRSTELVSPTGRLWEQLGPCEVDENVFTEL